MEHNAIGHACIGGAITKVWSVFCNRGLYFRANVVSDMAPG